jgi:hypothetical protein
MHLWLEMNGYMLFGGGGAQTVMCYKKLSIIFNGKFCVNETTAALNRIESFASWQFWNSDATPPLTI